MIKIGPATQTENIAKVHIATDLPGDITITTDNVDAVLSDDSVNVAGVQSVEICESGDNVGFCRRHDTDFVFRKNFTIGLVGIFKTNTLGVGPGAFNSYLVANKITAGGYAMNWGVSVRGDQRKLGFYDNATSLSFTKVFTIDTEYRAVLKVEETQVTLYYVGGSETLSRSAPSAGWSGSSWKLATLLVGGYQCLFLRQFQFLDSLAASGDIDAFIAGTGNLASSLYANYNFNEENGQIAYDDSGNSRDLGINCSDFGTYVGKVVNDGFLREFTTPLSGNEFDIEIDTTDVTPGTSIVVTATRTKTGFPAGRSPDISIESDTCVVIAAAPSGLSVVGVSIDKTGIVIAKDEEIQLVETVFPTTATNKNVTWASSNSAICTVSVDGLLKGVSRGNFTITVTTVDGSFTATSTGFCNADPVYGAIIENTMSDLLPVCLQNDLVSRAFVDTIQARFNTTTTGIVDLLDLLKIYNISSISTDLLDALAESFNVFGWDKGASVAQKRTFLEKVLKIQRRIGTQYAIKEAISLVIPDALNEGINITEGTGGFMYDGTYDYDGSEYYDSMFHWARFDVEIISSIGADLEPYRNSIVKMINHYKPVRCVLHDLTFSYTA